jgi:hypothetical protein
LGDDEERAAGSFEQTDATTTGGASYVHVIDEN